MLGGWAEGGAAHGDGYIYIISTYLPLYLLHQVLPSHTSWARGRDLCRRFGGRLHVDTSPASARVGRVT